MIFVIVVQKAAQLTVGVAGGIVVGSGADSLEPDGGEVGVYRNSMD